VLGGLRERSSVGDRVVEQHAERREPDDGPQVDRQHQHRDDCPDDNLGSVRYVEAW